jgi:hypothetical protein
MTELAKTIKAAIVGSFGCCHETQGHGCPTCLSQHIADVLVHDVERKINGLSR